MKIFKIATYNVNSVRSRLHVIIPWLRENRPDVLCMQETKVEDSKFPRAEFEQSGYHICYSGGKKGNGVAIASLEAPDSLSCGFGGDEPDTDRLIRAKFSGVSIINTYVPQGFKMDSPRFEYKLKWMARFKEFLGENYSLVRAAHLVRGPQCCPGGHRCAQPEEAAGPCRFQPPGLGGV